MPEASAIVLAAGVSLRFGGPKLMQPMLQSAPAEHPALRHKHGLSLLSLALQPWLASFSVVNVVVATASQALRAQVQDELEEDAGRINWLICEESILGMGHSLAFGVAHTRDASGWLIGLGDMPDLKAETLQQLKAALAAGHALVAPQFAGKRGHPVGFLAEFRQSLMACHGDQGARQILQQHAQELTTLEVDDPGVLLDIDTVADWQQRMLAVSGG